MKNKNTRKARKIAKKKRQKLSKPKWVWPPSFPHDKASEEAEEDKLLIMLGSIVGFLLITFIVINAIIHKGAIFKFLFGIE